MQRLDPDRFQVIPRQWEDFKGAIEGSTWTFFADTDIVILPHLAGDLW